MGIYLKIFRVPIGIKHLRSSFFWLPSFAAYGATAAVAICWITDYRVVMKKVPWYNQRFLYPYEDDKNLYYEPRFTLEDKDNA